MFRKEWQSFNLNSPWRTFGARGGPGMYSWVFFDNMYMYQKIENKGILKRIIKS
jgi:hypothetical protein